MIATTVTLSTYNRQRIRELQEQLEAERGRSVKVDEAIEFLFDSRSELVKLLGDQYEGGA